jgi:C-terminal processing protease CtpA/Prc
LQPTTSAAERQELSKRCLGTRVRLRLLVTVRASLVAAIDTETLCFTKVSADSLAAAVGLRVGDEIVMITGADEIFCAGIKVPDKKRELQLNYYRALSQRPMSLIIEREASEPEPLRAPVQATMASETQELSKQIGTRVRVLAQGPLGAVINNETLCITEMSTDSLAAAVGLRVGDKIIMITGADEIFCAGKQVPSKNGMLGANFYRAIRQRPMSLLIERDKDALPMPRNLSAAEAIDESSSLKLPDERNSDARLS